VVGSNLTLCRLSTLLSSARVGMVKPAPGNRVTGSRPTSLSNLDAFLLWTAPCVDVSDVRSPPLRAYNCSAPAPGQALTWVLGQ